MKNSAELRSLSGGLAEIHDTLGAVCPHPPPDFPPPTSVPAVPDEVADHLNALADHLNALADHLNALADHLNALADHLNALADHLNALADHLNTLADHLNTLAKQLEMALELSRSLEAQHTTTQPTISVPESKVAPLESLAQDTQTRVRSRVEVADSTTRPSVREARKKECEPLTPMFAEWKKID
ncbi:uncharacterized protein BXZ73DRAFT_105005 [Epithele typhae]|uniref:uncharacterized protein n=1 Tax=Epithele typhae TaxID=378194 RepID=UPI00200852B3|nr:uncharacterized protein BXZ73DRAFT_105005 [Epithele typhae]KAH9919174.1 hypothetical protein BXZ73DRAFT_105005 [Epithele typhae]